MASGAWRSTLGSHLTRFEFRESIDLVSYSTAAFAPQNQPKEDLCVIPRAAGGSLDLPTPNGARLTGRDSRAASIV